MKFPKEYLEEIKQRIKVSDIVTGPEQLSSYVNWESHEKSS